MCSSLKASQEKRLTVPPTLASSLQVSSLPKTLCL